jgi:hypothetical protein
MWCNGKIDCPKGDLCQAKIARHGESHDERQEGENTNKKDLPVDLPGDKVTISVVMLLAIAFSKLSISY